MMHQSNTLLNFIVHTVQFCSTIPAWHVNLNFIDNMYSQARWTNKQRLLVFASRGITYRDRHLMEDIRGMMAHARSDSKMEKKDNLSVVNEVWLHLLAVYTNNILSLGFCNLVDVV